MVQVFTSGCLASRTPNLRQLLSHSFFFLIFIGEQLIYKLTLVSVYSKVSQLYSPIPFFFFFSCFDLLQKLIQLSLPSVPNSGSVCCSPFTYPLITQGFPDSSVGQESACNAGDPGSVPGWGRSSGEGIGYPFQNSWASLVAQLVKNLPTIRETRVRSLSWEDPLEKRKATHSSILA